MSMRVSYTDALRSPIKMATVTGGKQAGSKGRRVEKVSSDVRWLSGAENGCRGIAGEDREDKYSKKKKSCAKQKTIVTHRRPNVLPHRSQGQAKGFSFV